MYDVRFLPAARQDMVDIARYIAVELKAEDSARALIEAFSAAVERLAEFPYACRLFLPPRPLKREYRAMPVKKLYAVLLDRGRKEVHHRRPRPLLRTRYPFHIVVERANRAARAGRPFGISPVNSS